MGACVICEEQITNPLSPQRIEEQISTWLQESRPQMLESFYEASDEIIPMKSNGEDFCIVNGNRMNVCAYCYTEHILKWLLSTKPDWSTMKEYFTHFDFDGERLGYTRTVEGKGYAL